MRHLHVLVAEDDPVIQQLLTRILTTRGHKVTTANNGHEALQALEQRHYDVVLLDIRMPGLDGIEVARRIRARAPDLRLVALTADATPETLQRCRAAGFDACLTKPVRKTSLLATIEQSSPASPHTPVAVETDRAPSATRENVGVIDVDRVKEIGALQDDAHEDGGMFGKFLAYAADTIAQMNEAFANGDLELVGHLAHKLEGSSGSIGAVGIANACAVLNRNTAEPGEIHEHIKSLERVHAMTCDAFWQIRTSSDRAVID